MFNLRLGFTKDFSIHGILKCCLGILVGLSLIAVLRQHSENYCEYIGFHCWCSEHQLSNMSYSIYADKHWAKQYVQRIAPGLKSATEYKYVTDENYITDELLQSLPQGYIFKPNHMSGEVAMINGDNITCLNNLCKSCKQLNVLSCLRMMCKTWLNTVYMPQSEPFYSEIKPKCMFEEYLGNQDLLVNYRVFTFHGKPYFIQVDGTFQKERTHDFFTPRWNRIQMNKGPVEFRQILSRKKPIFLDEMLHFAESLSHNFIMMRVDFFGYDNTFAFSEFTPAHHGCTGHFEPVMIEQFYGMVAENASINIDPEFVLLFNNIKK